MPNGNAGTTYQEYVGTTKQIESDFGYPFWMIEMVFNQE